MCPLTPEQHDEVMKLAAENHARQEAMNEAQRVREHGVQLCLVRAPKDKAVGDDEFQAELRTFSAVLGETGIKKSQSAITFDAIDAHGYPLPEFMLILKEVAPMAITAATAICVAWVNARPGRKVRLKIGDVEAEGQNADEIAKLLAQAKDFQSSDPAKTDDAE